MQKDLLLRKKCFALSIYDYTARAFREKEIILYEIYLGNLQIRTAYIEKNLTIFSSRRLETQTVYKPMGSSLIISTVTQFCIFSEIFTALRTYGYRKSCCTPSANFLKNWIRVVPYKLGS